MKHSDDWFKGDKDYSWVPGVIWFIALIVIAFAIWASTR